MLADLLPSTVAAVEVRTDPVGATLFPEEEAHVRDAVPKRRAEFTAVRWCARTAMADLGLPPAPVVPGRRGRRLPYRATPARPLAGYRPGPGPVSAMCLSCGSAGPPAAAYSGRPFTGRKMLVNCCRAASGHRPT